MRLLALLLLTTCLLPLTAADPMPTAPLDVTMTDIAGKPCDFHQWKGKVVLLVNVASRCGHTPQYAGLEHLYRTYQAKGLVVVGIPANNFGGQEPGSNDEIQQFCSRTYQVTFPMMAKVSVKGDDICPLYRYLTTSSPKPGPITWNFAKFLIGRDGMVVDRFDPKTEPQDPTVVQAIEQALAKAAP